MGEGERMNSPTKRILSSVFGEGGIPLFIYSALWMAGVFALSVFVLGGAFPFAPEARVVLFPSFAAGLLGGIFFPIWGGLASLLALVFLLLIHSGATFVVVTATALPFAGGVVVGSRVSTRSSLAVFAVAGETVRALFASILLSPIAGGDSLALFGGALLSLLHGTGYLFVALYLGEYLFSLMTRPRLSEVCSDGHPLVREMKERAMGTFVHARNVSILAEAAARAIGADFLLARAGGFFHDVGKLWNPTFYGENQRNQPNVHDTVTMDVSRSIIIAHIDEGVRRVRKHRLGKQMEGFVLTHHGDGPVYHFPEEKRKVRDRYPGPVPSTKEEGLVMLADALEAVTRCVSGPLSEEELEEMVRYVIERAKRDGQLRECPLSERELDLVREVFVDCLRNLYHGRVRYRSSDSYGGRKGDAHCVGAEREERKEARYPGHKADDSPDAPESEYH
ncbi:MAG: HDIG domain-containing protein [Deltaproteobacteria bacterium]|nr:MAG: HDIG domain-containing protein [Deltaproteobacteria bacterium]